MPRIPICRHGLLQRVLCSSMRFRQLIIYFIMAASDCLLVSARVRRCFDLNFVSPRCWNWLPPSPPALLYADVLFALCCRLPSLVSRSPLIPCLLSSFSVCHDLTRSPLWRPGIYYMVPLPTIHRSYPIPAFCPANPCPLVYTRNTVSPLTPV